MNGRLKGVASVVSDRPLPALVKQYNGTPVLMAEMALFGSRKGIAKVARAGDALEFCIDVGRGFSSATNYALLELVSELPHLELSVAWILEGRKAHELPESLVASLVVEGLDLTKAPDASAWLGS